MPTIIIQLLINYMKRHNLKALTIPQLEKINEDIQTILEEDNI